jgi:hypothetical protein
MLFESACLLPSAPPSRQRNRNRASQPSSPPHLGQRIPSQKSTPTLRFATNCLPKRKKFAPQQSCRARPSRMILCWAASSRRGRLTRPSVCQKPMPFGNANVVKRCAIESRSCAVRPFSSVLITASPARTLIAAPNHRDRRSQAAAHVERQITFRIWNLTRAGLLGQMLIRFENLSHSGRANRMSIAN